MAFPHGAPEFRAWTLPPHDMHGDFDTTIAMDDDRWRPPALLAHILADMRAHNHDHDQRVRESILLYANRRRTALLSTAMLAFAPPAPLLSSNEDALEDVCNWGSLLARMRALPRGREDPAITAARTLDDAARAAITLAQTPRAAGSGPAKNTTDHVFDVCWPSLLCALAGAKQSTCARWWDGARVPMYVVRAGTVSPVRIVAFDAYMMRIARAAVLCNALEWRGATRAWSDALSLLPDEAWSKIKKSSPLQALPETVASVGVPWHPDCLCSHASAPGAPLRMAEHCPVLIAALAYSSAIEHCLCAQWWKSARALIRPLAHLMASVRDAHAPVHPLLKNIEGRSRAAEVRIANALSLDVAPPAPSTARVTEPEPRPAQLVHALDLPVVRAAA